MIAEPHEKAITICFGKTPKSALLRTEECLAWAESVQEPIFIFIGIAAAVCLSCRANIQLDSLDSLTGNFSSYLTLSLSSEIDSIKKR